MRVSTNFVTRWFPKVLCSQRHRYTNVNYDGREVGKTVPQATYPSSDGANIATLTDRARRFIR